MLRRLSRCDEPAGFPGGASRDGVRRAPAGRLHPDDL